MCKQCRFKIAKKKTMWKLIRRLYKKKLGNTLCLAKWTQTNIYLASGMTHSCHHPGPHKISITDITTDPSALHNTFQKKLARNQMLNNIRPSECDYCWRVEDAGHISDRITKSFNSWSRPHFNEVLKSGPDGGNPKYLEVSFDNTCNLKCSYCGPSYSSKWVEELNELGPWPDYHNVSNNNILNRDVNPYIEAFWKWWPNLYLDLHTFRITGGEPLLSKHTYKVLEKLKENPNTKLVLGINSNLSVPESIIDKFINTIKDVKVKKLVIHTSCDTFGSSAEYARHGFNYNNWLKNCQRILKELPNAELDIMVTYNAFSVTTFDRFLEDIIKLKTCKWYQRQRVKVSISYLRYPEHLAVWVLPDTFKNYVDNQIAIMKKNKFTTTEINQLERILPLFDKANKQTLQTRFKFFVDEHDRRRNTNFLKSIPSMETFYKSI